MRTRVLALGALVVVLVGCGGSDGGSGTPVIGTNRVVYTKGADEGRRLVSVDLNGDNPRDHGALPDGAEVLDVSPDGRRLLVSMETPTGGSDGTDELYVTNVDASVPTLVYDPLPGDRVSAARFDPSGSRVAATVTGIEDDAIVVASASGGDVSDEIDGYTLADWLRDGSGDLIAVRPKDPESHETSDMIVRYDLETDVVTSIVAAKRVSDLDCSGQNVLVGQTESGDEEFAATYSRVNLATGALTPQTGVAPYASGRLLADGRAVILHDGVGLEFFLAGSATPQRTVNDPDAIRVVAVR